jgi:hypothetical protein
MMQILPAAFQSLTSFPKNMVHFSTNTPTTEGVNQ